MVIGNYVSPVRSINFPASALGVLLVSRAVTFVSICAEVRCGEIPMIPASLSVPAHKIKLWKVAIPTKDMNDEKMKILINKSHESINVKEELGGELLEAEDAISILA